jgi:gliding motility-associated-like protein
MKTAGFIFRIFLFLYLLMVPGMNVRAQEKDHGPVTCDFTVSDTVCVSAAVTITNLSQGASTYLWQFFLGTPLSFPLSDSIGTPPGALDRPLGIALEREGNTFYAFVTNSGDSTVLRVTFANSLLNPPVYDILNIAPGILTGKIFGIQVKNDNGNWYGFVTNGSSLVRLDFGPSLANTSPSAAIVANSPLMNSAQGLAIGFDGTDWVGFCTNFPARTITRFTWGTSLSSAPGITDMGNPAGLTRPMQPALISDNSGWYMFVANTTSVSQLKFGNSLLNAPVGTNLGNLQWITDNRGVSMFTKCGNPYALLSNHDVVTNQLLQIHFKGGLGGTKIVTPLGDPGNLFEITALSESLIIGDTIFCIAVNALPSLTTLYFPPNIISVIPPSNLFDPSPVVFPGSGTYTIKLIVDSGLPTEQQACKEVEVVDPAFDLGPDSTLCEGQSLLLDPGSKYLSYVWSTGATTETITVTTSGTYSVVVTDHFGCVAEDSVHVAVIPTTYITVDTTICYGDSYYAGGKLQSQPGTYVDTLTDQHHCRQILTTHLSVKPMIPLDIGKDTCMMDTAIVHLDASVPGATSYTWQDGTHNSFFNVTVPGQYWVRVVSDGCTSSDTILFTVCPHEINLFMPNAFTPNGDGLNDTFRPVANEVTDIHMMIFNRWGEKVFETRDLGEGWDGRYNGENCEPGVYSFILTYGNTTIPGETKKITGVVTLVR